MGDTAIEVGAGILRAELDRCVVVSEGTVILAFGDVDEATIEKGGGYIGRRFAPALITASQAWMTWSSVVSSKRQLRSCS